MQNLKTAIVTGVTGQDGSIISDQLIEQGIKVYGLVRRVSESPTLKCSAHLEGHELFEVVEGDLLDLGSLARLCKLAKADYFYHLASQSHVGTSFKERINTAEVTGLGTLRCLEAVELSGIHTRFYNAATSELFGGKYDEPYNEKSAFYPRSPYAIAKLFGFWTTVNFREANKVFAVNGILHNHESVPAWTPVTIRRGGQIDILPIEELMPNYRHKQVQEFDDLEVWENGKFVRATAGTAYPHNWTVEDKNVHEVASRCGIVDTTGDHVVFTQNGEVKARDIKKGQKLEDATHYPDPPEPTCSVTSEWAWFLGFFVADGYAGWSSGTYNAKLRNNDKELLDRAKEQWHACTGGNASFTDGISGFTGKTRKDGSLQLGGAPGFPEWLSSVCYTKSRHKRVPRIVLNAGSTMWKPFLEGYNAGDGLKAGHGKYEFKNFKTNSPALASQLMWMAEKLLAQRTVVHTMWVQHSGVDYRYFSINLNSPKPGHRGKNLIRDRNEILHTRQVEHTGYLFDLTTESGRFCAGVGNVLIHNSPRRGPNFVTRKITIAAARIKLGLQKKLELGNLEARRDWGWAPDYCQGMRMMLEAAEPDDYVLATGETHSVREFCGAAFKRLDIDYNEFVEINPEFYRAAEVDVLTGDFSKAKEKLGWEPTVTFTELVEKMVDHDLAEQTRLMGSEG